MATEGERARGRGAGEGKGKREKREGRQRAHERGRESDREIARHGGGGLPPAATTYSASTTVPSPHFLNFKAGAWGFGAYAECWNFRIKKIISCTCMLIADESLFVLVFM